MASYEVNFLNSVNTGRCGKILLLDPLLPWIKDPKREKCSSQTGNNQKHPTPV